MHQGISGIIELYRVYGAAQYGGEAVSQLEHALQCAHQAELAGASPALVAASFLHDIGHMVGEAPRPAGTGKDVRIDDQHQHRAQPYLAGLFPEAVLEPIRLHVDAKRYLCAVDSHYRDLLSPESKRSLELQGGVFSAADADRFIRQQHAGDAVMLRRWDDCAKTPGAAVPDLDHFASVLQSVMS